MLLAITLLDKASKVCGSDSELARQMGLHRVDISQMRSGKRTITPETAAELADIAGEDAREAAISAILERAKGTRREGVLREVLGKALAAGVAGVLVFSYSADSNSSTVSKRKSEFFVNSIYIVECLRRVLSSALKLLRFATWGKSPIPPLPIRKMQKDHAFL